jgi:hypothetical protein
LELQQKFLLQAILACMLLSGATWAYALTPESALPAVDAAGYVGNQARATCHASIYESYVRTSMTRAGGRAIENVIPADFVHSKSGVHYRIHADIPRSPTAPAAICRESSVPTSPTPRLPTITLVGARKHRRKYWQR